MGMSGCLLCAAAALCQSAVVPETRWEERVAHLRAEMARILQFPAERVALDPESRHAIEGDGYTVDAVTYAAEPGSRVTASLYLPAPLDGPVPGILMTCGHGGSKSGLYYQYAGQLYAKMGFALLVTDTIGEEERHIEGKMGARAHDMYHFKTSAERRAFTRDSLRRMVLGKMVWDLLRGVDYLESRPEVDSSRIGLIGNSMGGATGGCVTVLDARVRAAVLTGWGLIQPLSVYGKDCTSMPYEAFARAMSFAEMTALTAPHAATLYINGSRDTIIDPDEDGAGLARHVRAEVAGARRILADAGVAGVIEAEFVEGACHRPYVITPEAVAWMREHLMRPDERRPLPAATIRYGDWVEAAGRGIERLYDTEERSRGAVAVDVGVVYHDPKRLACLPSGTPPDEYTWEGWVERMVSRDDATPERDTGR